jgi:fructokinase
MVVFGSMFGIQADIRNDLVQFIKHKRQSGNIIYYDPNVRPAQFIVNARAKEWIIENIRLSHIVKGSCEDFNLVFNTKSSQQVYFAVKDINPNIVLIVTADKNGADLFTPSVYKHINAPTIIPVSTIGAGDTFSAGLILGLIESNVSLNNLLYLSDDNWDKSLHYAIQFATEVCLSLDNYIGVVVGRGVGEQGTR